MTFREESIGTKTPRCDYSARYELPLVTAEETAVNALCCELPARALVLEIVSMK